MKEEEGRRRKSGKADKSEKAEAAEKEAEEVKPGDIGQERQGGSGQYSCSREVMCAVM